MMPKTGRPILCSAVLLAFLTNCGSASAQDGNLEDRVKATFIFNFVQYSAWPRSAFSSALSFTICIVGDSVQGILMDTVRGETVNGRPIAVRSLSQSASAAGCHLIYFRESANRQTAIEILNSARMSPILTVGETPEFLSSGGIIRFTKTGNRLRFEINPNAAERVSLSISSRLLRLADIVHLQ